LRVEGGGWRVEGGTSIYDKWGRHYLLLVGFHLRAKGQEFYLKDKEGLNLAVTVLHVPFSLDSGQ